jgi:hypothetical protein
MKELFLPNFRIVGKELQDNSLPVADTTTASQTSKSKGIRKQKHTFPSDINRNHHHQKTVVSECAELYRNHPTITKLRKLACSSLGMFCSRREKILKGIEYWKLSPLSHKLTAIEGSIRKACSGVK